MIILVILMIVAFVLLTALIEKLSGMPENQAAIIAGLALGVIIVALVVLRCLLRRSQAVGRNQRIIELHGRRNMEDYNGEKRGIKFFRRRNKEISQVIESESYAQKQQR